MLRISNTVVIPDHDIVVQAVRASGPGGQHVNKTASAAHLFFDIRSSSLPAFHKGRLLGLSDQRITQEGIIVIKAQEYRSLQKNRDEALARLRELIRSAVIIRKTRRPTQPSRSVRIRRVESKKKNAHIKSLRGKVQLD